MFGDKLGHVFDRPLVSLARKISFSPNVVTVIGCLISICASFVLVDNFRMGGILILVAGFFDILDGVVARVNNKSSQFGAFLDSFLDRYSDAVIMLAVAFHLADKQNYLGCYVCIIALVGAFLVSYARARAEGLAIECKAGLMERPERVVLISLGTISGLIMPTLWILVTLTYITVVQRVYIVWKHTRNIPVRINP